MCTKQKLLGKAFQFIQINQAVPNQKYHIVKVGIEPVVNILRSIRILYLKLAYTILNLGMPAVLKI